MSALSSLSSALGLSDLDEPVTAGIATYDPLTGESGDIRAFQYFPEQVSDSRGTEWARRQIPGGSHPLLTWVSGGERVISFTAIFTQDANPESKGFGSFLSGGFDFSLTDNNKHSLSQDTPRGGIPAAIAFLRQFTYPDYVGQELIAQAPSLAVVYLPNSGIISATAIPDSIVGAMTECNVTYEAFHRNGAPRIVAISLSFIECIQTSLAWRFQGRNPATTSVPDILGGGDDVSIGIADLASQYKREMVDPDN